jgi:hydroxyacylglutathione hydrolase
MNTEMKKILLLLVSFIISGMYITCAQVFKNADLQISQLEEGVWVVETTDMGTMYIIEGDEKALLIDTGTKCDSLDKIIGYITKKPYDVVITHAHHDHAGNIHFFNEIYLHPADTVLLQKSYSGAVNFLKEGDIFDLGGRLIEVKHMPAHTPGSIVLIDREAGICFSGDAFGSGMVWLQLRPYSPMQTYINSCRKMEILMDEGINRIYCGHYPHVKKAHKKDYITAMRKLAESLVNGTAPAAAPFPIKVPDLGCENPMIVTQGDVSIVFDPEHIK